MLTIKNPEKLIIDSDGTLYFDIEGTLESLTSEFEDRLEDEFEDEMLSAYIDGNYYSIPIGFKSLAERLQGKYIKAKIATDRRNYSEVRSMELTQPKIFTAEMWKECSGIWDVNQWEASLNG